MLIMWIRKTKNGEPEEKKGEMESFQQHDKAMKAFKLSHPQTGLGNAADVITINGNVLAAVHHMKLTKNTQN